jgi:hypothetical protein
LKIEHTNYAVMYVNAMRRRAKEATWLEVANAYDAGLSHAAQIKGPKREELARYLRALRVVNAANRERIP